MKADYIYKIIENVRKLPYDCILFDGSWGIGKTYAIREALKEQKNICYISMFGLQSSQEIYHEILFQFALNNSKAGKTVGIVSEVLNGIATICKPLQTANEAIQSVVKEKELFLLQSKTFDSLHVIVIDDLERISEKVNIEEVFGIIEELKKCSFLKLILVANTKEMQEHNKAVYQKYNEKVIERTYHITERAEGVKWDDLGIQDGFIKDFLTVHKVKNLRTLRKAQKFYDDVHIHCKNIKNQQFEDEIRLMCFAIVVESMENLYYNQEISESDPTKKVFETIQNELEHRIFRYLNGIKSSRYLVDMLFKYYNNEIILTEEFMKTEYKKYIQAGQKPNYYKTDKEIREILPTLEQNVLNATTIEELNRAADECEIWREIIGENNKIILDEYRKKVSAMLWKEAINGRESILQNSYESWHIESGKVKEIYAEEKDSVGKMLIRHYIDHLKETTKGREAFEYSYKLREYSRNFYYRDIIKESADELYNRKSFPVDEIDSQQYHTCYNIMSVLYHFSPDKFCEYTDKLIKNCDKMSAYRMDVLIKEIKKDTIS